MLFGNGKLKLDIISNQCSFPGPPEQPVLDPLGPVAICQADEDEEEEEESSDGQAPAPAVTPPPPAAKAAESRDIAEDAARCIFNDSSRFISDCWWFIGVHVVVFSECNWIGLAWNCSISIDFRTFWYFSCGLWSVLTRKHAKLIAEGCLGHCFGQIVIEENRVLELGVKHT